MYKINNLVDYPAIKKLAAALHKFDANHHGAAIMIGSGFSRSAACHVGGDKKMPLWDAFSKKLAEELNPNSEHSSISDPLRVAEEYRSYFGQAALNDRIRFEIDDDTWKTGELYQLLLRLPWSEIMTTNWDTLLERAARDVHSPYYTPVTKPSDLAWAPSPRIVKLHGTVGITDTFVAAQEDYRVYPEKFASFVNFARQAFIENELCLLGFSGNDPNFLQWAGWVRDQLAGHARKIYWVGALKLTAARRKHLESINIAPVDLYEAVEHLKGDPDLMHKTATEFFLKALKEEGELKIKKYEWMPKNLHRKQASDEDHVRKFKEPEYAASLLKGQLDVLKKDRESYPGWVMCPPSLRDSVRCQLSDPWPTASNIAALEQNDRSLLLYEIAWRHSITFEYISPWLAEAMFDVVKMDELCAISKRQQMEIALVLLKNSRFLVGDDAEEKQVIEEHVQTLISMLERYAQYIPDCSAELAYHKAMIARDALDYAGMEALVDNIAGDDPVWKLRQASLLMELGRFDDGSQLIAKAYGELRISHRQDRYSIPILSRLMWAHWLLERNYSYDQSVEELPAFAESVFRKWKCEPLVWIKNIEYKINEQREEYIKSQNPIEPSFEQGHYRDNSNADHENNGIPIFLLFDGVCRTVGIPLRFKFTNVLAGSAEQFVIYGGSRIELWDNVLAFRSSSGDSSSSITKIFTRIGVARSSLSIIDILVTRLLSVVAYWREKCIGRNSNQRSHAISSLSGSVEILARLVVRVSPEKAKEIFALSVALGQQIMLHHHWLFDPIGHMLTYSLKSIPLAEQGALLPDALAFPLMSETGNAFHNFPNPIINHLNARDTYIGLEKRVDALIEAAAPSDSASCTDALLRLLPLAETEGFLTQAEQEKLARVLWGNAPDYQTLPVVSHLFVHVFLLLPAPDKARVKELVRRHLYEHGEDVLMDTQQEIRQFPSPKIKRATMIYSGMANAAANEAVRLFPTPEQALTLFDRLVMWRPPIEEDGFWNNVRAGLMPSIGNALSYAIVPALSAEDKTVHRFELLKALHDEVDNSDMVILSLVYFCSISQEIASIVEKVIQKAIQANSAQTVSWGALSLLKWVELSEGVNSSHIDRLILRLIVIVESGRTTGLQQLLYVAGEVLKKGRLSEEQVLMLIEATPNAFNAADYSNIELGSPEAVSASSIREACSKLANTLVSQFPDCVALQKLLREASEDALPEVRFALIS